MKLNFMLPALICCSGLFAQEAVLRGTMLDENAEPLVGVTLRVKEAATGASTGLNGRYEIKLKPGVYTVDVYYTGYDPVTITGVTVRSGSDNVLDEELAPRANILPEVVIVAYKITCITTHCCYCVWPPNVENPETPAPEDTFLSAVFPNPAIGYFNLTLSADVAQAEIYDTKGALLRRYQRLNAGTHRIPVADLPAGAYVVRLVRENKIYGHQMVVVRG